MNYTRTPDRGCLAGLAAMRATKDFSREERARFSAEFRRSLRRYRRGQVFTFFSVAAMFFGFFRFQNDRGVGWLVAGVGCFVVSSILNTAFYPKCPVCRSSLLRQYRGPYCPECGGRVELSDSIFPRPQCNACGKTLRSGKRGRNYRIRHCAHCGVLLHQKGF